MRIRRHLGPLAGGAVAVVLVVGAAGCGGGGAARPTTGKGIYEANCATCHGADGQGAVGPALAGVVATKYPNVDDQIAIVTNGKGAMPSWRNKLTPKEIRKVVEYTRTGLGQ
jgi:mono/diheme cytochrome c family protein